MSLRNNILTNYFKKSYEELEKVTWLTKKQMIQSSLLVISIAIVVTGLITVLDYVFNQGYIKMIEKLIG